MVPDWVRIEDDISNARVNFELVTSPLAPMTSNEQAIRSKRDRQSIPCCTWASARFQAHRPGEDCILHCHNPSQPASNQAGTLLCRLVGGYHNLDGGRFLFHVCLLSWVFICFAGKWCGGVSSLAQGVDRAGRPAQRRERVVALGGCLSGCEAYYHTSEDKRLTITPPSTDN